MRLGKITSVCLGLAMVFGVTCGAAGWGNSSLKTTILADGGAPLPPPTLMADGGAPLPPPTFMADGGAPLPPPYLMADGGAPLPLPQRNPSSSKKRD